MFCKNCGTIVTDDANFCESCGTDLSGDSHNSAETTAPHTLESHNNSQLHSNEKLLTQKGLNNQIKCLPSFILGLVGGLCGIFGGFCTTVCDIVGGGNAPFFLIFCDSIIGIIGACLCLSKAKIGSLVEIVAGIMIMLCAYGKTGSDLMSVIGMILFLFGGIIGLFYSFVIKRNKT